MKYIIVIGYSADQLAKKVSKMILEGYKPLGWHQVTYIQDEDIWEYTLSMVAE